jgi:uncharacterized membrane protein
MHIPLAQQYYGNWPYSLLSIPFHWILLQDKTAIHYWHKRHVVNAAPVEESYHSCIAQLVEESMLYHVRGPRWW